MHQDKNISPQAISCLKEALSVLFWKKDDLYSFLKIVIENKSIIPANSCSLTKREVVKELIERMINRQDIYQDDLLNLIISVSDQTDFSHLSYWDPDGLKTKIAKEAVAKLRVYSKGFSQITKEQEDAKKKRIDAEQKIKKNISLSDELESFKLRFYSLAGCKDVQKRGYDLEKFLYDLFLMYDLDPKGSFKIVGEQIDGAFTFKNSDYLLEAKWANQVNRSDLATFCFKVESKLKSTLGLLVTINGVTSEAISPDFKSIIIMDGSDIVCVLEQRISLPDLLFKKRRKASETGNIYVKASELL